MGINHNPNIEGDMAPRNGLTETPEEHGTPTNLAPPVGSVVLTIASLGLTAGLLAAVAATQARFNRIFTDFGTDVPMLTRLVRSSPFLWLVASLFVLTVVKELVLRNWTAKATWSTIAILVALLLGILYSVGMFVPLMTLIQSLSE